MWLADGTISHSTHGEQPVTYQEQVLDDAERERIDEALRPLQDPETREVVRRIMIKGASAKKTLAH